MKIKSFSKAGSPLSLPLRLQKDHLTKFSNFKSQVLLILLTVVGGPKPKF